MADERTKPPYNQPSAVPAKYNWPTLLKKDGDDLFDHYRHIPWTLRLSNTVIPEPLARYHTNCKNEIL